MNPLENAKPCPFCGSKAENLGLFFIADESACFVRCDSCGACGPDCESVGDSLEEATTVEQGAVQHWNSRPDDSITAEDRARALEILRKADTDSDVSDDDMWWFRAFAYRLLGAEVPRVEGVAEA